VATSVAARGLDVKKLILVVNYDAPNHYEGQPLKISSEFIREFIFKNYLNY
jgi:hypothetical protein